MKITNPFIMCECNDNYTYEAHGDGYAVYFARCVHRHGYNIMDVRTHDPRIPNKIVGLLNDNLDELRDIVE